MGIQYYNEVSTPVLEDFVMNVLLLLIFSFLIYLTLADDSPIAVHVNKIHQRIPDDKKREYTVKFLNDPKHWKGLLEKAAVKDWAGLNAVYNAIGEVFKDMVYPTIQTTPKFNDYKKQTKKFKKFINNASTEKNKDKLSIEKYVGIWVDQLVAFDDVMKLPNTDERFTKVKPLGDLAEPLSLALKKLNPGNWDKDFYDKLVKAAENKYYGGYLLYILLAVGIVLLVIGVTVFLILRRKKKIQPVQP